ncbi:MAG TPA: TolC family protein, partial [Porphyromonadaceae bacterium]|nr:TolC family protein [Porphyromonadaceae bacterium]
MISKIKYILVALCFIFPLQGIAQHLYTLEECLELSYKNNATLKNSVLEQSIAKQTSREALTKYFPNISANGGLFYASDYLFNY